MLLLYIIIHAWSGREHEAKTNEMYITKSRRNSFPLRAADKQLLFSDVQLVELIRIYILLVG